MCLRKLEVCERLSVCDVIENSLEHSIHCLLCSYIGVGRFRILGGPRFRIFGGGGKGEPHSQHAHGIVTTSMRRNDVDAT